jgi:site-specific DNA-methyltransferase (adenine-specific)
MTNTTPDLSIRHGGCVQGMTQLDAHSVDVVVTSPPYNLGQAYSTYDDNKSEASYIEWSETWALQIKRILKPDGSFFLNFSDASENPFFAFEVALSIFHLQNTIHWIKSISIEQGR